MNNPASLQPLPRERERERERVKPRFSRFVFNLASGLTVGLLVGLIVLAFTGPGTRAPGTGNPDFWIKSESGNDVYYNPAGGGNVGIGTAAPGTKLEVNGQIKITGGTPGANKVLTSDSVGLATWQSPASVSTDKVSAYPSAAYTLGISVWQKILINTAKFDTNSILDATNNRIVPKKAGYYQVNASLYALWSSAMANLWTSVAIYKNGSNYVYNMYVNVAPTTTVPPNATISEIIYFNGATDYIELYGRQDTGGTANGDTSGMRTYLSVVGPL